MEFATEFHKYVSENTVLNGWLAILIDFPKKVFNQFLVDQVKFIAIGSINSEQSKNWRFLQVQNLKLNSIRNLTKAN